MTGTVPTGPVRVVLQTEAWGMDPTSVLLNDLAPTFSSTTFTGTVMTGAIGEVDLFQNVYYWDLASAPSNYYFAIDAPVHTSFAQVAVDIAAAPVPEPETYAMLAAGLGLVGWQVRRRNKAAKLAA
ncbi:MAG: PEP-CTERM sorting domain-containing protein [Thiobacillus sp.]|nr:PEP-CTERM sorting domain-containing protein [Thiobacillus sp.]